VWRDINVAPHQLASSHVHSSRSRGLSSTSKSHKSNDYFWRDGFMFCMQAVRSALSCSHDDAPRNLRTKGVKFDEQIALRVILNYMNDHTRKVCLLSHRTVPNEAGDHRAASEPPPWQRAVRLKPGLKPPNERPPHIGAYKYVWPRGPSLKRKETGAGTHTVARGKVVHLACFLRATKLITFGRANGDGR